MKSRAVLISFLLAAPATTWSGTARPISKAAGNKTQPSALVERVGNTGVVQLTAESFHALTPKQKELAWWLSRAAIAIDPIAYDQFSRFGNRQKYVLDLIVARPEGIDPAALAKVREYAKLFYINHGNHNDVTAQKFLPAFSPEELEAAALQALKNAPHAKMSADELRRELAELRQAFFDPQFEPQLTAKSPRGALDIIQASANNFYAPGVTLADVEKLAEKHPLNSRVVKTAEGLVYEEVYRAGTPDGSVKAGRYAAELQRAIGYLERARAVADEGQAAVIDALIRYYQTGEMRDWLAFGAKWAVHNPRVDFVHGFVETYRDPRGSKGSASSFVSVTDEGLTQMMTKIADNAQYFENRAPWAEMYKKQGVQPPVAKAIETLVEAGDFGVTTVGQNLPNENEIREKYGTKNFFFTGSTRALNRARGQSALNEFAFDAEEKRIAGKYGELAGDLMTALHEVVGHGSGKVNPRLTEDPYTYLREYAGTLEEARADLVALWDIWDPKMKELGLIPNDDVARAMYYAAARAPLVQLRSNPTGDHLEEDHQRDRQLIIEYIIDKVPGAIERVKRNGKTYIVVRDFKKMREGVGMLLAEIMRIKGEGDYEAGKALVEKYGVRFDPATRDEVIERYRSLNIPTYWGGVHPELTAKLAADGAVEKVEISYPRDLIGQRLRWARMYRPEL